MSTPGLMETYTEATLTLEGLMAKESKLIKWTKLSWTNSKNRTLTSMQQNLTREIGWLEPKKAKASTATLMANTTRDSGKTTKWKVKEKCTGTIRMKSFIKECGPTTRGLETAHNVGTLVKSKSL